MLEISAVVFGSSVLSIIQAAFWTSSFAASSFEYASARGCWMPWWAPMGWSNTSRSLA